MGCQGGEWHIRKVWLTMPVAGAGLLPPSPVINVLSACNPTPTLNEARIYHLGRVADVRGKGIQVAGNNILFLACPWHVWQALKTTKKVCVSTNFIGGTFVLGSVLCCTLLKENPIFINTAVQRERASWRSSCCMQSDAYLRGKKSLQLHTWTKTFIGVPGVQYKHTFVLTLSTSSSSEIKLY